MSYPTLRERATTLLSAVAALAILGLCVTAQPTPNTQGDRIAQLESDLRYQLELGSRVDRKLFDERTAAADHALAAWRDSPHSPGDRQLITDWLRSALLRSLPGESGPWPSAPQFSQTPAKPHLAQKPIAIPPPAAQQPPLKQKIAARRQTIPRPAELRPAATRPAPNRPASPIAKKAAPSANPAVPTQPAKAEIAQRPAPTPAQSAVAYNTVKAEPISANPPAASPPAARAAPPVQVDLAELNARVAGYHEGLREIEAAIIDGREEPTVARVAQCVTALEQLAGQYEFVRLYYDALTTQERRSVVEPRSTASTVELVDRERARIETADDDDFLASNDVVEEGELELRLKTLAAVAKTGTGSRHCCD